MALAEERRGLLLHAAEVGLVGLDVDLVEGGEAEELLHRGGVGHDDLVVGVEPALVALGLEDADDQEVDALHLDRLAEGVFVAEEVLHGRRPEDGDAGHAERFALGERAASLDLEAADAEVGGRGPDDAAAGVLVVVLHLGAASDEWGDALEAWHALEDGLGVLEGEGLLAAGGHAAEAALAGAHDEQVGAHRRHAVHDLAAGACGQGEHGDDGADADDDAEHGEERT